MEKIVSRVIFVSTFLIFVFSIVESILSIYSFKKYSYFLIENSYNKQVEILLNHNANCKIYLTNPSDIKNNHTLIRKESIENNLENKCLGPKMINYDKYKFISEEHFKEIYKLDYDDLNKSKDFKISESCSNLEIDCGIIDTMNNKLCLNINSDLKTCPLFYNLENDNYISISSKKSLNTLCFKNNELEADIKFDDKDNIDVDIDSIIDCNNLNSYSTSLIKRSFFIGTDQICKSFLTADYLSEVFYGNSNIFWVKYLSLFSGIIYCFYILILVAIMKCSKSYTCLKNDKKYIFTHIIFVVTLIIKIIILLLLSSIASLSFEIFTNNRLCFDKITNIYINDLAQNLKNNFNINFLYYKNLTFMMIIYNIILLLVLNIIFICKCCSNQEKTTSTDLSFPGGVEEKINEDNYQEPGEIEILERLSRNSIN